MEEVTISSVDILHTINGTMNSSQDTAVYGMDPADWGFWIKFISTPIIVAVGIVGNMLSIVVMKSKALRHKSYSLYLCALAVFDTTTLVIRLIRTVDEYYTDNLSSVGMFQNFTDISCKLFNFLEHVSYLMSSWLVVLMAVERLFAVCFPFRHSRIRRQKGAVLTICVLLTVVCLSQSFRLIMVEHISLRTVPRMGICAAGDAFLHIFSNLHVYFYHLVLSFVLPVTIILVCNSMVFYQTWKVNKDVKRGDRTIGNSCSRRRKKTNHTTYMLLILSFTYIVTLFPILCLSMVVHIAVIVYPVGARHLFISLTPYMDICIAFSLLNYAVNFFIYVLSGKMFRYELNKMLRKRKSRKACNGQRSTKDECIQL